MDYPEPSSTPPHRKMTLPVVPSTPISALNTPFITDEEGFMRPWAEWEFNEWEQCTDTELLLVRGGDPPPHAVSSDPNPSLGPVPLTYPCFLFITFFRCCLFRVPLTLTTASLPPTCPWTKTMKHCGAKRSVKQPRSWKRPR